MSGHGIDPIRLQVRVLDLPLQAADVVFLSIELDNGLRFDTADNGFAGHQVIIRDSSRVGPEAKGPADEPVAQNNLLAVEAFLDANWHLDRCDEPVCIELSARDRAREQKNHRY